MKVIQQNPDKPGMKPTRADKDSEADCSIKDVQTTPKCRETLRILNEIFETTESQETCRPNDDAISS